MLLSACLLHPIHTALSAKSARNSAVSGFVFQRQLPVAPGEAEGCGGLHAEYELAWKAEGETFFDVTWRFASNQFVCVQRI